MARAQTAISVRRQSNAAAAVTAHRAPRAATFCHRAEATAGGLLGVALGQPVGRPVGEAGGEDGLDRVLDVPVRGDLEEDRRPEGLLERLARRSAVGRSQVATRTTDPSQATGTHPSRTMRSSEQVRTSSSSGGSSTRSTKRQSQQVGQDLLEVPAVHVAGREQHAPEPLAGPSLRGERLLELVLGEQPPPHERLADLLGPAQPRARGLRVGRLRVGRRRPGAARGAGGAGRPSSTARRPVRTRRASLS